MSNKIKIKQKGITIDNVNQEAVLETVLSKLDYCMLKDLLIKPLPTPMVMKHIVEQVPTGKVDEGLESKPELYDTKEYDKEVESVYRKGIVLYVPDFYVRAIENGTASEIKVGDIVVFPFKYSIDFDLFKDTMLVKPHDIIAIVKNK